MCTYQITIDERTKEGKAIKKYILKAGAVKVSDKVGLDGMSYDYRRDIEKSIKSVQREKKKYRCTSLDDLEKLGL